MVDDSARKAAWLADRRKHITGTDVAAILGVNSRKTALRVWLEKKGEIEPEDENEAMRWGKRLERIILEVYAEEVGEEIVFADPFKLIESKKLPILGATLDAEWLRGDRRPVDAKNVGIKHKEWGDAGTDKVPQMYVAQILVQAHVLDTPCGDIAALFSGNQFARYTIDRDEELEEIILERVGEWWERHVVKDTPPPMDGSEKISKWLAKRFAQSTGLMIPPKPEHFAYASRIARIKAFEKRMAEERARCENMLKEAIGAADGLEGLATWKFDKDATALDEKAYIAALESIARDYGIVPDALTELRKQFTKPKPPVRRFILKEVPNGR